MAFFEYLFLSLLGFCSFMVICSRNPLHSILSLISVFLLSSILVFCLEAEFLALSFILVYVGAIAVLFLFVIIMSDIKISDSSFDILDYSAFGYFFLFAIIVEILVSLPGLNVDSDLVSSSDYLWINWYFEINHLSNAQTLGQILYTDYFVFFLSAGFILFIALIGSLMLTVTLNKSYKLH